MDTRLPAVPVPENIAPAGPAAAAREPDGHDGHTGPAQFWAPTLSALLRGPLSSELQALLGDHMRTRRWFRGKARELRELEVLDRVPLPAADHELLLCIVHVRYAEGEPDVYVVPLALAREPGPGKVHGEALWTLGTAARSRSPVFDPTGSDLLSQALLGLISRAHTPGEFGQVVAHASLQLQPFLAAGRTDLQGRMPSGEQSNTTVFFGRELTLKLFRLLEDGSNPDVEINEFLWRRGYRHVPEPLGSLSYRRQDTSSTLAIAQRFAPSQGTAWDVTLDMLRAALSTARSRADALPLPSADLLASSEEAPPASVRELLGPAAGFAELLGRRSAELHVVLASDRSDPAFAPEPFTPDYVPAITQATRDRIARNYALLHKQLPGLPEEVKPLAHEVLARRDSLLGKLQAAAATPVRASRIRCHSDYHLGQVLYDGTDFVILDFEGEPAQPIEVRRQKRSALYDVCGMLRSFHYAATFALQGDSERAQLTQLSEAWYRWMSAIYLGAYLREVRAHDARAVFLPETGEQLRALLPLHVIDKCSYELGYELNNRPAWAFVPLSGLLELSL